MPAQATLDPSPRYTHSHLLGAVQTLAGVNITASYVRLPPRHKAAPILRQAMENAIKLFEEKPGLTLFSSGTHPRQREIRL